MYKIAVVGDKESILGFSAIGMDIFECYEEEEIKNTIQKLVDENYAVIYITENASMKVNKFISKFQTRKIPAIVTVPGNSKNLRYGETRIKEMCKNAVGIEINFK